MKAHRKSSAEKEPSSLPPAWDAVKLVAIATIFPQATPLAETTLASVSRPYTFSLQRQACRIRTGSDP
jgi:hypothetical protein